MKRVFIVDDEMLVRVGLKTMIPWEDNGFTIVGEAQNGEEALNQLSNKNVDILITDIAMPIIDGLELIKKIRSNEQYNHLKIIFLTHFRDFDYARTALNYGASDYILKSELNPKKLLDVLKVVSEDVSENIDQDQEMKKTIREVLKNLVNNKYYQEDDFKKYMYEMAIDFDYSEYFVFCGNLFNSNISNPENISKKSDIFRSVFENTFNFDNIDSSVFTNGYDFIGLFYIKNSTSENFEEILPSKIFQFSENVHQFLDTQIIISPIKRFHQFSDLYRIFYDLKIITADKYFLEENESIDPPDSFSVDLNYFYKLLLKYDANEITKYLKITFSSLKKSNNVTFAYKHLQNIFLLIHDNMSSEKKQDTLLSLESFRNYNSFSKHKEIIINLLKKSHKTEGSNKSTSYLINKAKNYICTNYNKDLSLTEIADFLEISTGYLSILFKKEMDMNIKSYINKVKIEEAKNLLVSTNDRIYIIAENLGFNNPYYFSKLFKEIAGVSCKEYRNMYSKTYGNL